MAKYYFGNHKAIAYHSNYLIAEVIIFNYRVEGGYFVHPRRVIFCPLHLCSAAGAGCGGLTGEKTAGRALIFVFPEQMRLPDPMRGVFHDYVPPSIRSFYSQRLIAPVSYPGQGVKEKRVFAH